MPPSRPTQSAHSRVTITAQLISNGYAALKAGNLDRAESLFRRALQADVRLADAWRGLAETQYGARRGVCLRWAEYLEAAQQPFVVAPYRRAQPRATGRYRRVGITGVVAASVFGLLLLGSDVAYRDRVLPGVVAGSVAVGNEPFATAKHRIVEHHDRVAARTITIHAGDRSWRVSVGMLLLNRTAALSTAAVAFGHEPAFWSRAETRMRALLGDTHILDEPHVDTVAVERVVATIAAQINRDRRDAQLIHTEQGWSIIPEQAGRSIDQPQTIAQLTQLVKAQSEEAAPPASLTVEVRQDMPRQTASAIEPLREHLQQLSAQPLSLSYGDQHWSLDRSLLMDTRDVAGPAALKPSKLAINQQLDGIAANVAVAPQPSHLIREAGRVRQMVQGQPGRELNWDAAVGRIEDALINNLPLVELPMHEVAPPPGEIEQLGLIAEIGRGESQFLTYSSPERDANVQAGGNDIDGVLIAPGEVFSFTGTVGAITEAKGYRWGEAIEAGTVVPSLGGGICQVSTTTFRAAFWSGLEIVERHNHSWRLPWYETDAPPGMDATIALGGPDLKFRNNTAHYILIKVETDLAQKRQTVIFYGTPDGRKVDMQPAANGNIAIHRYVLQGTNVIADDTFASYYSQ